MPNWCTNTILIIGPSEDVRTLYKSLEEYRGEVDDKGKETGVNQHSVNICDLIKVKFSDKLPAFTEDDYRLSYNNLIKNYLYSEYNDESYLAIYTESAGDSRMYALVKLIELGFPKCIMHYRSEGQGTNYYINTDESGRYFPER